MGPNCGRIFVLIGGKGKLIDFKKGKGNALKKRTGRNAE